MPRKDAIVLFSSGLAHTHLAYCVFGSGSHTEQFRRRLKLKFSWTELKELFHLKKRRLRKVWSPTSDLRGVVRVQKKRHVLLNPRGTSWLESPGFRPSFFMYYLCDLELGTSALSASLFSSVKWR